MPADYPNIDIPPAILPAPRWPFARHLVETYASETNKTASVWREFGEADITYRPHVRSSTVGEIMQHQLLSERRFFGEFMGRPEPEAESILPQPFTPETARERLIALAVPRLTMLADASEAWWLGTVPFFDTTRERIWVFWRRVLHSAHHRTQLTVYLRLLERAVPSTYGPTADVTWVGADPTRSVEAAARR